MAQLVLGEEGAAGEHADQPFHWSYRAALDASAADALAMQLGEDRGRGHAGPGGAGAELAAPPASASGDCPSAAEAIATSSARASGRAYS